MNLINYSIKNLISESKETDSNDEVYFEWWLQELQDNGFIESYHRACSFLLSDIIFGDYNIISKKKVKTATKVLLNPILYTPDYVIIWTKKAEGLFYLDVDGSTTINKDFDKPTEFYKIWAQEIDEKFVSIIDIKPSVNQKFVKFTSSHTFVVKQAMMYQRHRLFVDKVKIISLMKASFTPAKYLKTDKGKFDRKLKFNPISLSQYFTKLNYDTNN